MSLFKNSPSNLKKHVQGMNRNHLEKYIALTLAVHKRRSVTRAPSTLKQLKLGETKRVAQRIIGHAVLNFMAQILQPFSLVDQPAFKALVHDLQPNSTHDKDHGVMQGG